MKHCKFCDKLLCETAFCKRAASRDGLNNKCKECANAATREWFMKNRAKRADYDRQKLLKKYGLTAKGYDELARSQGYKCAICFCDEGEIIRSKYNQLSIDHCHETGRVRGLLCNNCNRALGLLGDNKIWLENALKYLGDKDDKREI